MASIKKVFKALIPPLIISLYHKINKPNQDVTNWSGKYATWSDAKNECVGYDSDIIVDKCKNALLKVKNKEAVYERDSVLFDKIIYSTGVLAGLQKAALENGGCLNVLDFGGSLGSSYYQNKDFLEGLRKLNWNIVEQENFVDIGKKNFENIELKFYYTIEEYLLENKPDVLLLSSVLQYLEKPHEWVDFFIKHDFKYIIIDRTAYLDGDSDLLTVQKVSPTIYEASYPAWFFDKKRLFESFLKKYEVVYEFNSHEGYIIKINDKESKYSGVLWKRRS